MATFMDTYNSFRNSRASARKLVTAYIAGLPEEKRDRIVQAEDMRAGSWARCLVGKAEGMHAVGYPAANVMNDSYNIAVAGAFDYLVIHEEYKGATVAWCKQLAAENVTTRTVMDNAGEVVREPAMRRVAKAVMAAAASILAIFVA